MAELPDSDPQETQEWVEALEAALEREGTERAHFLLEKLIDKNSLALRALPEGNRFMKGLYARVGSSFEPMRAPILPLVPRWARFAAVGASAAAVHLGAVWGLVEIKGLMPLIANILGFLPAFCVSYTGHAWLTFGDLGAAHMQALPRFFLVACVGFASNEILYALLLQGLGWPYLPALMVVLLIVAAGTYLASRHWAFMRATSHR